MKTKKSVGFLVICLVFLMLFSACATRTENTQNTEVENEANAAIEAAIKAEQESAKQEEEEAKQEPVASVSTEPVKKVAQFGDKIPDFVITSVSADKKGTVEKITYMAYDYIGNGEPVEKKANVYLPAGYDETKQYNVIYLMHGIGGSENEWSLQTDNSKIRKILDNLIANGDIEPLIVVTPNGHALACEHTDANSSFYNFGLELRNDLIPYIESHYATYAEYSEDGYDLTAARTHRAMAGLSMGGMQTINIGVCECLDIMSWFGAFSAAPTSYAAAKVAATIDASEYEIDYFYNICGTEDKIAYWSASNAAKGLDALTDKLTADENFKWHEKSGDHSFNIWNLGIYNFLLFAFK